MSAPESGPDLEASVAGVAPEAGEFGSLDLAGLGQALASTALRATSRPAELVSAVARFCLSVARTGPVATARWLGVPGDPPASRSTRSRPLTSC
jgi:hypothetical protein